VPQHLSRVCGISYLHRTPPCCGHTRRLPTRRWTAWRACSVMQTSRLGAVHFTVTFRWTLDIEFWQISL